jgi:cysteine desulfurase
MKSIYLDHAATTYVDPLVLEEMLPYFSEHFGNPSSEYSIGRKAKAAIDRARATVAGILHAQPEEIIFTGSGTESDNLAIFGIARAYKHKGNHIIISKIEHKAVLEAAQRLEKEGFEVTYLDVNNDGLVDPAELERSLRPDTILISIMYANNEIGTIQPVAEISSAIKRFKKDNLFPLLHTDACQAAGALDLDVTALGVDLLTFNGSKTYGPKGVGCLYVASDIQLEPILVGGGQENSRRAGTENVAAIVGLAEALKISNQLKTSEGSRLSELKDYCIEHLLSKIEGSQINGDRKKRLPNNINISISGVEGESLLLMLDNEDIFVSTGSACTSTALDPSHVLLAIGRSPELAHGSLRITLGRKTTKDEIDRVLDVLPNIVTKLRKISSIK